MKSYFQSLYKILVSIFNYFFQEDTNNHKRVYERLISAWITDTMEYAVKQSRNNSMSYKERTEQPVSEQKEPTLYQAQIDIKEQFRIWSANMKEYDALRKRILEGSSSKLHSPFG